MITLRPEDQMPVVERLRAQLREHQSVLLRGACGFGKTVVASYMVSSAHKKRKRVTFAVHRRELARQTAKTFDQFGIPYGYIMAGQSSNPFASVQIASAGTLINRKHQIPCDLFIPDEAHLWGDGQRAELIELARKSGAHIVPLTATPARGDGKPLRRIADTIVEGPTEAELILAGNLARYRVIAPSRPDLSKLHTRMGEYVPSEVDELMGRPAVVKDAVNAWIKFAYGKRTIGFAPSRKRGSEYAAEFRSKGVSSEFIDGETPDHERRRIIADFAAGRILVLMNCQLFREGFDLSAQVGYNVPIQCVLLCNPTQSLPLAIQMMMRCMRPQDDEAIIIDCACITIWRDGSINHGFPEDVREWSLDGTVSGKSKGEKTMPTCTCEKCFGVFRIAAACPYCGHVRLTYPREVEEFEAEMHALDPDVIRMAADFDRRQKDAARIAQKIEERSCKSLADWEALAKKRGHARGWAFHMMRIKGKAA